MLRREFPLKKSGDPLEASHINSMGAALTDLTGRRPGSFSTGRPGEQSSGYSFDLRTLEITNRKINDSDTETSGLYLAKERYYSFTDKEWKSKDEEWQIDARDTFMRFEIADDDTNRAAHRVVCYWDEQRGMFLPLFRIWPPQERRVKISESGGITAGTAGTVDIWTDDAVSDPLETAEAEFTWMDAGTAGEDQEALIQWTDDQDAWVIINLECE